MPLLPVSALVRVCARHHDLTILSLFSILYFAVTCLLAVRAPLWYDELFTFYLARLDHFGDLWAALAEGTDATPPLFHVVTRLAQQILGVSEFGTRLPAVIGFWVMCVSLYFFVARRCRRPYAVVAMLFPLATAVYPAAYAARPYGLFLGCSGLALLCWQSAAEGQWRRLTLCGLAVSLMVAFASHYYAFLLLVPLGLAELTRTWMRRRVDLSMWLVLSAGPVVLFLLLPLALSAQHGMTPFAFLPGWGAIGGIYHFLLKNARWPLLAALLFAVVFPQRIRQWRSTDEARPGGAAAQLPVHEIVVALGLVTLPIIGVCMGQWVTGFFTARYAMPMVIGCAILLAFIAERRTAGSLPLALVLTVVFLGHFVRIQRHEYRYFSQLRAEIAETTNQLHQTGDRDLPVVVTDPFAFLQLTHYAPAPLRPRLVYLSDLELSRRHNPTDPRDWALRQLRHWSDVPVYDYPAFVVGHRHFMVYGDAGWLRPALEARGLHCRPQTSSATTPLFEVEVDSNSLDKFRP